MADGTGGPLRDADVVVAGDRIVAVDEAAPVPDDADVIDVGGRVVAPGFVDVHTHDDFAALVHPDMGFKVLGGVTTCIVGNCGMGAAPFGPAQLFARALHPKAELEPWEGYAGYLDRIREAPPSVNIAALVGQGTVRADVLGFDDRRATDGEIGRMRDLVAEGMEAGAVGMSTGLIYEPSRFADTDEIVALAEVAADAGGLYATHMRDEAAGLLDAVREAITVGERAGLPVQISHHKVTDEANWGLVTESLALIDDARARGITVAADQYPYTAGSTVLSAVLQNRRFDADADESGGLGRPDPASVVIASASGHPEWEGRSIAEVAAMVDLAPQAAAEHVLAECPGATTVIHAMCEDDVQTVMRHPSTMIGSDGLPTLEGKPHPRLYGTFARVLGRYARDLGVLSLPEAVHRMTGLAAATFGLGDRGEVAPGAYADLVVFDAATVAEAGTFVEPHHPPVGIDHVLVNGEWVVRSATQTGAMPGRVLTRTNPG